VNAAGNVLGGVNIGTYNVAQTDPQRPGLDPTVLKELQADPCPTILRPATASIPPANSRNTVYGRLVWGRDDSICDVVNTGQPVFPGQPCLVNTLRGPRNFAVNWRLTPTGRMTNEFVIGQNRYDPIFGQPSSLEKISWTGTPVDNTQQFSFGNSGVVSTWQVVDNFAYMRGAHAFKFGANLRRVR
jgi:hypothetical protein